MHKSFRKLKKLRKANIVTVVNTKIEHNEEKYNKGRKMFQKRQEYSSARDKNVRTNRGFAPKTFFGSAERLSLID